MKIGIVGLGYWGNIILRNLESMNYKDITLCDIAFSNKKHDFNEKYKVINDYKELNCDCVFITTPTSTHDEICSFFLKKSIRVFCEKPLAISSNIAIDLYELALSKNIVLFTDWIFTFNSQIETIKRDYDTGKLGKIRSIFMNRLNLGPERYDVNARWDLASHDVSIIQYLFSKEPKSVRWTDYRRNWESKQEDSSLGLIEYGDFSATVNVSWYYRKKVRECVFEFENYFIVWDDFKRFLQYEDASNVTFPIYSGNLSYPCSEYQAPLKNAIDSFFSFSKEDMIKQRELTIQTISILEGLK